MFGVPHQKGTLLGIVHIKATHTRHPKTLLFPLFAKRYAGQVHHTKNKYFDIVCFKNTPILSSNIHVWWHERYVRSAHHTISTFFGIVHFKHIHTRYTHTRLFGGFEPEVCALNHTINTLFWQASGPGQHHPQYLGNFWWQFCPKTSKHLNSHI